MLPWALSFMSSGLGFGDFGGSWLRLALVIGLIFALFARALPSPVWASIFLGWSVRWGYSFAGVSPTAPSVPFAGCGLVDPASAFYPVFVSSDPQGSPWCAFGFRSVPQASCVGPAAGPLLPFCCFRVLCPRCFGLPFLVLLSRAFLSSGLCSA